MGEMVGQGVCADAVEKLGLRINIKYEMTLTKFIIIEQTGIKA